MTALRLPKKTYFSPRIAWIEVPPCVFRARSKTRGGQKLAVSGHFTFPLTRPLSTHPVYDFKALPSAASEPISNSSRVPYPLEQTIWCAETLETDAWHHIVTYLLARTLFSFHNYKRMVGNGIANSKSRRKHHSHKINFVCLSTTPGFSSVMTQRQKWIHKLVTSC